MLLLLSATVNSTAKSFIVDVAAILTSVSLIAGVFYRVVKAAHKGFKDEIASEVSTIVGEVGKSADVRLEKALAGIKAELSFNSGGSVKDRIYTISRQVDSMQDQLDKITANTQPTGGPK